MTATCARCGTMDECPDGGLPPGWTVAFEDGRMLRICDACARSNIRAIEGNLPTEYWEA